MRTTVTIDDDLAVALEELRKREGLSFKAALNQVIRVGIQAKAAQILLQNQKLELELSIMRGEKVDLADLEVWITEMCLNCKKAKCVAGCPVDIDIPGFIQLIKEKKYDEAIALIKEKNNLPRNYHHSNLRWSLC